MGMVFGTTEKIPEDDPMLIYPVVGVQQREFASSEQFFSHLLTIIRPQLKLLSNKYHVRVINL